MGTASFGFTFFIKRIVTVKKCPFCIGFSWFFFVMPGLLWMYVMTCSSIYTMKTGNPYLTGTALLKANRCSMKTGARAVLLLPMSGWFLPCKFNLLDNQLYFKVKDTKFTFIDPVKGFNFTYEENGKMQAAIFRNGYQGGVPGSDKFFTRFWQKVRGANY